MSVFIHFVHTACMHPYNIDFMLWSPLCRKFFQSLRNPQRGKELRNSCRKKRACSHELILMSRSAAKCDSDNMDWEFFFFLAAQPESLWITAGLCRHIFDQWYELIEFMIIFTNMNQFWTIGRCRSVVAVWLDNSQIVHCLEQNYFLKGWQNIGIGSFLRNSDQRMSIHTVLFY